MLPADQRLRRSAEFSEVVRRGRRASRALLTVHLLAPALGAAPESTPGSTSTAAPTSPLPRAGLVVGKAVGGSVARSRTSRQLRHVLRPRMAALPGGARLVVRAAPAAAGASSAALAADLDSALAALAARGARPPGTPRRGERR